MERYSTNCLLQEQKAAGRREHVGPGRSVQGVQEAAAAEGGPARGQGCLTPGVRLPFPFHHVHWGWGRAGERETWSEGRPTQPAGSTGHGRLQRAGSGRRGATPVWFTAPSLLRCLAHVWNSCANAGDICSAPVRPRFPATSPSPSYMKPTPAPYLMLV